MIVNKENTAKIVENMRYDGLSSRADYIELMQQRIDELEKELKDSDDDLTETQKQLSEAEATFEDISAFFTDSDNCLIVEPLNSPELCKWLANRDNKMMARGVELAIDDYRKEYIGQGVEELLQSFANQLRTNGETNND